MRILLVEDDPTTAEAVRLLLERQRFAVVVAHDGEAGLDALLAGTFDAALIDVVLPRRDGFSICRAARDEGIRTPLLIVTALDSVEDRVRGLDSGADDYLVKPFAAAELAARLRALLRRQAPPARRKIVVGDLTLDLGARCAFREGKMILFSATEYRLVQYLALNPERALSRNQILDCIWGEDFSGSSNIVDVYVSTLRKKLAAARVVTRIVAVRGLGYKLTAACRAKR